MPSQSDPICADIFCRVVDNYGDMGVCWRLARRLAHGHAWRVRLWIDDLTSFSRLEPAIDPRLSRQFLRDIEVVRWQAPEPDLEPAEVIIEAFACDPPPAYVARIRPEQIWINLEYLSAEKWVDDCHALPSPQPDGVLKTFFFPGFSPASGGLLREKDLLPARDAFQTDPSARERFLTGIGVAADQAQAAARHETRVVSLFCYKNAPVDALLTGLSGATQPTLLLVTEGSAPDLLEGQYGNTTVVRIAFLSQDDYDRLLWLADLNIVRGEDSFVRAQWAGRPMVWHIYPQSDDAHVDKLAAWLDRYAPPTAARELMLAWNADPDQEVDVTACLTRPLAPATWSAWRQHAAAWARTLTQLPELADAIAEFHKNRLNSRV